MNTASPKIKENRMKKQDKKNEELKIKIDKHIEKNEKYYIDILDEKHVNCLLKVEPTDTIVIKTLDHFLKFRDFKFPININFVS